MRSYLWIIFCLLKVKRTQKKTKKKENTHYGCCHITKHKRMETNKQKSQNISFGVRSIEWYVIVLFSSFRFLLFIFNILYFFFLFCLLLLLLLYVVVIILGKVCFPVFNTLCHCKWSYLAGTKLFRESLVVCYSTNHTKVKGIK